MNISADKTKIFSVPQKLLAICDRGFDQAGKSDTTKTLIYSFFFPLKIKAKLVEAGVVA